MKRALQVLGWIAAWAVLALALTAASRAFHLGPGFRNPLPYSVAALVMNQVGRLLRRWLGEGRHASEPPLGLWRALRGGFSAFIRDTSGFNNFILLSLAYFLGVGMSALFTRLGRKGSGSAGAGSAGARDTYWVDTDLGKKEADAYSRPY